MKKAIFVMFVILFVWVLPLAAQVQPPAKPAPIYNPDADSEAAIAQSLAQAAAGNRHVLLMFGANWCPWCHRLHSLFRSDKAIAEFLDAHYILVMIDIGEVKETPLNMDLEEKYRVRGFGYPCLAVLDAKGRLLAAQESGVLEKEKRHDPERVLAFLKAEAPHK